MKYIIHIGDALQELKKMPDQSVQCWVTSPPYWGLRDYGTATWEGGDSDCDHVVSEIRTRAALAKWSKTNAAGGGHAIPEKIQARDVCPKCGAARVDQQLGLEKTPEEYVAKMVEIFREARRVLRDDGTLWLNLGDTFARNGRKGDNSGYGKHADYLNGEPYPLHERMIPNGLKAKDIVGIPWMVAFALRSDGWYLRQDIIWHKPNPMPESVKDRCTKSHEYIFLFSKSGKKILWQNRKTREWSYEKPNLKQLYFDPIDKKRKPLWQGFDYYFDHDAIKEPVTGNAHPRGSGVNPKAKIPNGWDTSIGSGRHGNIHKDGRQHGTKWRIKQNESFSAAITDLVDKRNKRSVWTVPTHPFPQAHFATFPPALIEPCILAGCPEGGLVGDMFAGAGTTGIVALKHFRRFIGIELNPIYANEIAIPRIEAEASMHKQISIFENMVES